MSPVHIPQRYQLPSQLMLLILEAAADMARHSRQAFRIPRSKRRGLTLHPGKDTPLWNALVLKPAVHPDSRLHAFAAADIITARPWR